MMTLKLPGRITADGKLEVELPEGISPGVVVVTIEGVVENAASDVGIMHFDEFTRLFELALDEAVLNAEHELGRNLSRNVEILLYGAGHAGDIVSVEDVSRSLFISPDKFYRAIDVSVQEVSSKRTLIFMRVSGHKPVPLDETWSFALAKGPFKQILAQIKQLIE